MGLTDQIQFASHDVALVALGGQIGQRHLDDRVRIDVGIEDVVAGLVDGENVHLVAAGDAVAHDALALSGLAPGCDDDREVLVVLVEADQPVDLAVLPRLEETTKKNSHLERRKVHNSRPCWA